MRKHGLQFAGALALAILFAPVSAATAASQTLPAAEVEWACGQPDESWISFCHGYVQAIFDAFHRPREYICPAEGTTRTEMAQAVFIGLKVPAGETGSGAVAAARILAKAYPCG